MKPLADLLGDSPGIEAVREKVQRLLERQRDARRLPPVLIQGETGTGKGLLARALHRAGPRGDGPFVDVNCAAIPETLLEAEMFGFERGAFTDARRAKPGLFQTAHRGTIFLDEVGLLPEAMQAKLLKVLEERTVRRLGATRDEPIDVWIVTATNEDLRAAIAARRFREDLYHRLAVLTLALPPLRERDSDIVRLATHFLTRACEDYGVPAKRLSEAAAATLVAYHWPGNVRELGNVMERVALLATDTEIGPDALGLPAAAPPPASVARAAPSGASLDDAVREHLAEVLTKTGWNISRSAASLGISRNTLRARIEKYGLRPDMAPRPAARRPARAAEPPGRPAAAVAPAPAAPAAPLRWERRPVTLLRAVLSTPEDVEASVDTARGLEALIDKATTFGGRVEAISPSAILVAFGLTAVEDAPSQAGNAAMAMQRAIERSRAEDERRRSALRISVHVGQFLVGQGAGEPRLEEDDKRRALDVLEALNARAERDAIVVSEAAAPLLERRFELLELGERDRGGPRLFAVVGRERSGFGPVRRATTFVGRQRELELLGGRLEAALRGRGQIVGIAGDAGIGKSRLLFEFRQSLAGKDVTYLEGRGHSYGVTSPYLPVLDVLRGTCGIVDTDAQAVAAAKVRATLVAVGLEEGAPSLLHVLDLAAPDDPPLGLEPAAIRSRVFETVRQLSVRLSRQSPLVLVLEDLHWIDRTSEEFFASLADVLAGARILLVSTYRAGYRLPWSDKSYATQIALPPLAPEDSLRIVQSVLPAAQASGPLVELILARAEGNPLFLEELARAVREQGGASAPTVPGTIQGVLLGRIDRLSPEDKRLLQIAAVVGKDVAPPIIEMVAEMPADMLREGLARLTRAEFLDEVAVGSETEYTFRHALTHEVAYGSLLPEWRRDLHVRLVDAIERLHPERLDDQIERVAHHALHGEIFPEAVDYLRRAGLKAITRAAHRESVAWFEQALTALSRIPENLVSAELGIDLRLDLRASLVSLGELERSLSYLREAESIAVGIGDEPRLGRVFGFLIGTLYLMGEHDRALDAGRRALALARRLEDVGLRVSTNAYLGQVNHALGNYREAAAFFRDNVASLVGDLVLERLGLPQLPSVHSRTCLVWSLAEQGDFDEGVAIGEEAIGIAARTSQPLSQTVAFAGLGVLNVRRGDFAAAIPLLEQAVQLTRTLDLPLWFARVGAALGTAYAHSSRATEGVPLLERALERAVSMKFMGGHALLVVALGEGYLLAGDVAAAAREGRRALDLARHHKERGYEAWALRLLAESALAADDLTGAASHWSSAMALAAALGMRPLEAHGHLGLAALSRRRGKDEEAANHAAAADAAFGALGMTFWRERAARLRG
ncbi:MAG TPA: sigma 54-interacting transcriptional regulator [Methylomirabilota bacterium]|nr:sigma 54-interacting transcriptional regulator [Methylomirabilota bacterium]